MAVDVSRASHTHQTPQVGRPQHMPMTSVRAVITMAISADAAAVTVPPLRLLPEVHDAAERGDDAADVGHDHDGTWT